MTFLAAGWLVLLLPWFALAAWLWRREIRQVPITGRFFWPESASTPSREQHRRMPPPWILIALLSLLAIIAALSNPIIQSRRVTLAMIVDSHISMGAAEKGETLLERVRKRFEQDLKSIDAFVDVEFTPAGGEALLARKDLLGVRFTAKSTATDLEKLSATRNSGGQPTVVLSAQRLTLPESTVRYGPVVRPENVAITRIGASIEPIPQLMLVFTHPLQQHPLEVTIRTPTATATHRVAPDPTHTTTTVFLELPDAADGWVETSIDADDGFAADDRAFLVRAGGWPRLEIVGAVPPTAERFAAVYSKVRPPGTGSSSILLTAGESQAPSICFAPTTIDLQPQAIWLESPSSASSRRVYRAEVARVAESAPEALDVLARVGDRAIFAVKRSPTRQVWIGFDVHAFAQTAEWVAWMNGITDWLNKAGPPRWESGTVDAISPSWMGVQSDASVDASPGIYQTSNGEFMAANMPPVQWETSAADQRGKLRELIGRAANKSAISLAPFLCGIGVSFAIVAGVLMGRRWRLDGKGGAT